MDTPVLEVTKREEGIKAKHMRLDGRIPAIYYGPGKPTQSLEMEYRAFRKIFLKAGENTVIDLSIDGKKVPVLVHQVQYDPVSDDISHVDFIHVDMTKEVTTTVKVTFVGEAPAVKNLGGVLDVQRHEIKIKCLPANLIHSIEVDVSSIEDFRTSIRVKDLKVPSTIVILDDPESTVVSASMPRVEEESKPAEEGVVAGAEGAAAGEEGGAVKEGETAKEGDTAKEDKK